MISEPLIERLVAALLAECDPDRIILFGSHAKSGATIDSDIDLLLIGRFGQSAHLLASELSQQTIFSPVPVDILLASPTEAAEAAPSSFLGSILASGRTLYERQFS